MNENNQDFSNCPSCPDLKKKLDRIDEALVGPDGTGLNSGVVKLLTDLRNDFNNYKKEAEGKRRQRNAYLVPLITGIGVFAICEVISLVLMHAPLMAQFI